MNKWGSAVWCVRPCDIVSYPYISLDSLFPSLPLPPACFPAWDYLPLLLASLTDVMVCVQPACLPAYLIHKIEQEGGEGGEEGGNLSTGMSI